LTCMFIFVTVKFNLLHSYWYLLYWKEIQIVTWIQKSFIISASLHVKRCLIKYDVSLFTRSWFVACLHRKI
jgi:hypothetical protein